MTLWHAIVALVDEDVFPVGRLKDHLTKWVEIDAVKYILDIISSGYKISFKSSPDRVCLNNNIKRDNVKRVCTEYKRHIDQFIHEFSFRIENVKVARGIFQKGYFLFSFDLKSAYNHIEILKHYWKFPMQNQLH